MTCAFLKLSLNHDSLCSGSGSSCLDDNPNNYLREPSIFHKKLPGQIVNATLQCKLQYGVKYFQCGQRIVSQMLLYAILCV